MFTAALWDIMLCILIDENVENDFWEFAKSCNYLTSEEIYYRQPYSKNADVRKTQEKKYISAITNFANSGKISAKVAKKILKNIEAYEK